MQGYWKKNGVSDGFKVRMGITSGYCTVGNFGSNQRMDYTVLGKPVNLAARLQSLAQPGQIVIADATNALVEQQVGCSFLMKSSQRVSPAQSSFTWLPDSKMLISTSVPV